MSPTIKYLLIAVAVLCCHNSTTAQTPAPDSLIAGLPASDNNNSTETQLETIDKQINADELRQQAAALEENLITQETSGPWDYQLFESLMALAKIQRDLDEVEEARLVYNRLLQNLRVNRGVYSIEQLPILLDLMVWYLEQSEYQTADELGDWAEFLIARNYSDGGEIQQQLEGYNQLINIRLNAPRTHACFDLNLRIGTYENRDYDCMATRRYRAEHFIGAFQLQRARIELIEQQGDAIDLRLKQQQARLATISIMTAGIVSGIHAQNSGADNSQNGYFSSNGTGFGDDDFGGYTEGR